MEKKRSSLLFKHAKITFIIINYNIIGIMLDIRYPKCLLRLYSRAVFLGYL